MKKPCQKEGEWAGLLHFTRTLIEFQFKDMKRSAVSIAASITSAPLVAVAIPAAKEASRYDVRKSFEFFYPLPLIYKKSRNLPYYVRFSKTPFPPSMRTSYLEAP